MAKNQFAAAHFHDEEAARVWFEAARWPNGPVCPKCGSTKHYATKKLGRYRCGSSYVPQGLHRHDRDGHGAQPRQAYSVGRCVPSGGIQQEGLFGAPAPPRTRLPVQHRLVSASSRHGSDAPWRPRSAAAWWRRQDRRGRRNLFRRHPGRRSAAQLKTTRPSVHARTVRRVRSTSAPSSRLSSAAARSAHSTFRAPTGNSRRRSCARTSPARARLHTDESNLYQRVGKEFAAHETVKHTRQGICARRRNDQYG